MNWKKYIAIIGIFIFVYLLIKLDVIKIMKEISKANLFLLLISVFLVFMFLIIQTSKWFFIAKNQKISIPFKEAFKINLISNFYGFITPSKIGTIIRAKYLEKYGAEIGTGVCNFTLDKILDISSVLFIAIIFSFIFRGFFSISIQYLIMVFLILIFLTLVFMKKERSKFLLGFIYRKIIPENIKAKARLTFNSFYENMPKKRYMILFFLLNIINWIFVYFISFLIGRSLGINLPFIYFLAILPLSTLVSLIPISIDGLGTKEATLIFLFSLFGIEATKVFSMSIIFLFVTGILPALIGSFFAFKHKE